MRKREKLKGKSSSRKMHLKRIRRRKKWISLENNSRKSNNINQVAYQRLIQKTKMKRSAKFQNSKGRRKNR